MRLRPQHVGALLVGAALLLVVLNLLEPVRAAPHSVSAFAFARVLIGLPVVLLVPAFFFVPALFRKDVTFDGKLDLGWALLAAAGANLLVHVVHFNVLRLVGVPIEWPALMALAVVEAIAGLLFLRTRHPDLEFAPAGTGLKRGLLAAGVMILGFAVWNAPSLMRDGSWYFYSPDLQTDWAASGDRDVVVITWEDGSGLRDGEQIDGIARRRSLTVENQSSAVVFVPLLIVVHTRVGTTIRLMADGRSLRSDQIANLAPMEADGPLVERYWEWGAASVAAVLEAPPGQRLTLQLTIEPPANLPDMPDSDVALVAWSMMGAQDIIHGMRREGHHHMHPYQLLNVTENIRWAHEVAGDYVLAGRSPDGSSTLHQPPAWTYIYAPARELMSDQTVSAAALYLAILFGFPLVGLLGIRDESGEVPSALLGIALGLGALQHGRLMVADGSINFPDSLYALALVVAVVTLVSGRTRLFVLWAVLCSVLRYPGAVVIVLAGGTYLALDPARRRKAAHALIRFGLALAVFCGVMLMVGTLTGRIDVWFFALYFETIPEHFNNNSDALPLLERPLVFMQLWFVFGGAILLAAAPLRGKLSKVALGTAVLYAPFLMFIDHFSHHYFLPLIGLAGVSACASLAHGAQPRPKSTGAAVVLALAAALYAAREGL
jgi:hypothetical protein